MRCCSGRVGLHRSDPQDYIWQGQGNDGENVISETFTDTFQNLLRQIPFKDRQDGLLYDPDGKPRVVYCLRHTYATQRLLHGDLRIEELANNMGTSVAMIQKHYSHVTNIQKTAQLISDKRTLAERSKGAFPDSSRISDKQDVEELRALFEAPKKPAWLRQNAGDGSSRQAQVGGRS